MTSGEKVLCFLPKPHWSTNCKPGGLWSSECFAALLVLVRDSTIHIASCMRAEMPRVGEWTHKVPCEPVMESEGPREHRLPVCHYLSRNAFGRRNPAGGQRHSLCPLPRAVLAFITFSLWSEAVNSGYFHVVCFVGEG